MACLKRAVTWLVSIDDKRLIELEAAQRKITQQQLLAEWLEPRLREARAKWTEPRNGRNS